MGYRSLWRIRVVGDIENVVMWDWALKHWPYIHPKAPLPAKLRAVADAFGEEVFQEDLPDAMVAMDTAEWSSIMDEIREAAVIKDDCVRVYEHSEYKCYEPWDDVVAFVIRTAHDCGCAIAYARIGDDYQDNDLNHASDEYNGHMAGIGMRRELQDYE